MQDVLTVSEEDFAATVEREAEQLKDEIRDGTFDNPQAIVGLEYELYGVAEADASLRRMPRPLLELVNFEGELGLHNAEFHTNPQPLNEFGLRAQQTEAQSRLEAAQTRARAERIRLVSDGLWTVPPAGESARTYLTDSVERDGVRITTNVADDTRYQAMANADTYAPKTRIETPHVDLSTDVVMPKSLTTSIQPHYQVPHAPDLPERFRYALRVAGPLLALGVNSPFFPPELYDTDDAHVVLDDHWMENRIPVFEDVLNPESGEEKVRFPADVTTVEEAVDRIAADPPLVPMRVESEGRFDDAFRHFEHKHGSFWRWVRPVFEGATTSSANARIEFRALPAQPTIRDSLAFVAAFAGLMESLPRRDHPVLALDWDAARRNFYAAMRDGLDADFQWITAKGEDTDDTEEILTELLAYARDGLTLRGLSEAEADEYLDLLRTRVTGGITPAGWKRRELRRHVEDGKPIAGAVREMQASYVRRQSETLVTGTFHDWLDD